MTQLGPVLGARVPLSHRLYVTNVADLIIISLALCCPSRRDQRASVPRSTSGPRAVKTHVIASIFSASFDVRSPRAVDHRALSFRARARAAARVIATRLITTIYSEAVYWMIVRAETRTTSTIELVGCKS